MEKVPSTFISRHAISRTYLYRLAFMKRGAQMRQEISVQRRLDSLLSVNNKETAQTYFAFGNFLNVLDRKFVTELRLVS